MLSRPPPEPTANGNGFPRGALEEARADLEQWGFDPPAVDTGARRALAGWDDRLTLRLRALLHASPLLRLKAGESYLPTGSEHYDLLTLGLAVFDLIIENTGLDSETDSDSVARHLAPLLREMDHQAGVEPEPQRHRAVADRVIAVLRNDAERRRPFRMQYTAFEDGRARTRELRMRLVEDRHHPDGRVVLALSAAAANLFLRALDLDIEDSQIATEAIVRTQLARGKFQRAAAAAADARLLSIRYKEKVERVIRDTRRNLRRVDWAREVRPMLDEALEHLTHQLTVERGIAAAADERAEALEPGSDSALNVARVRTLIAECERRHVQLHRPVMTARAVFLDEQERQAFTRPAGGQLPNLETDVLLPLLRAHAPVATPLLDVARAALAGPVTPPAFNLAEMVGWQLQPRRDAPPREVERTARELVDPDPLPERFSPEVRARADEWLRGVRAPRRLSAMLADALAAGDPREVLECVALLAVRTFGPRDAGYGLRAVRVSGAQLDTGGVAGDELILFPLEAADAHD